MPRLGHPRPIERSKLDSCGDCGFAFTQYMSRHRVHEPRNIVNSTRIESFRFVDHHQGSDGRRDTYLAKHSKTGHRSERLRCARQSKLCKHSVHYLERVAAVGPFPREPYAPHHQGLRRDPGRKIMKKVKIPPRLLLGTPHQKSDTIDPIHLFLGQTARAAT